MQLGDTLTNRETGETSTILALYLLMEEEGGVPLYVLSSGERVRDNELDAGWIRPKEDK